MLKILSIFAVCVLIFGCSSKQNSKSNTSIIVNSECHSAVYQGSCRDKNGNLIELNVDKK